MLNMFLSSLGWDEGTDPEACPEISAHLEKIKTITWRESLGLSRRSSAVDAERAAGHYESAHIFEYRIRQTDFSASGINARMREETVMAELPEGKILKGLQDDVEELVSGKGLEADFGTLCHHIIEWRINHEIPAAAETPEDASEVLRQGFGKIDGKNWKPFFSAADSLAKDFFHSDIWIKAAGAVSLESELPFTALRNHNGQEVYVKGVIDLIMEQEEEIILVDFKTDRKIIPGEYDAQMRIYMDAASELFSKPVRCSLFYLREGIEVEVNP
jgi:ATP-dependent exoDNAse (exonuclease V) beta subunit